MNRRKSCVIRRGGGITLDSNDSPLIRLPWHLKPAIAFSLDGHAEAEHFA